MAAGKRVAIGIGSNVEDRLASLRFAIRRLNRVLANRRISAVYETDPVGYVDQPTFLNACCVGWTRLTPHQMLSQLQDTERAAGRRRGGPRFGPRELDLDLLIYGDLTLDTEHLVLPHPRVRERAFVLVPLAEIAPEWTVPASTDVEAATVAELAAGVEKQGVERTEYEL